MKIVAKKWVKALENSGYEHHVKGIWQRIKIKRFSRIWRIIFKRLKYDFLDVKGKKSCFEVGCGGGIHLASFVANGWNCVGLDCSKEVIERAKNYLDEVMVSFRCDTSVKFIAADFFDYNPGPGESYDLVFHAGVLEHFIDDKERQFFLNKMFSLAKPGGYVISLVPSGVHLLREKMRKEGLGGYFIPEIDYSPEIIKSEFEASGAKKVIIFPHNLFNYLVMDDYPKLEKFFRKSVYYLFQLFPKFLFTDKFLFRHSTTLVGIAQK